MGLPVLHRLRLYLFEMNGAGKGHPQRLVRTRGCHVISTPQVTRASGLGRTRFEVQETECEQDRGYPSQAELGCVAERLLLSGWIPPAPLSPFALGQKDTFPVSELVKNQYPGGREQVVFLREGTIFVNFSLVLPLFGCASLLGLQPAFQRVGVVPGSGGPG